MKIDKIIQTLDRHKLRATYGAVGEALGVLPIAVGKRLGEKRPEASWVVSSKSGKPSGYLPNEIHPDLYTRPEIIRSGDELRSLIVDDPAKAAPTVRERDSFRNMAHSGERLIGIDLAWKPERNGSAIAIGTLANGRLTVDELLPAVLGLDKVSQVIRSTENVSGLAIDAPLILNNQTGGRPGEYALNKVYGARSAGCYLTNLDIWPDAAGVQLARSLIEEGYEHLGDPSARRWMVECYPHPAIVEIFGLAERLAYKAKKNRPVAEQKAGQASLAVMLKQLRSNNSLPLEICPIFDYLFDEHRIHSLKGAELKENEDALDAVLCLYIAAIYATGKPMQCFGDKDSGYIVVPGPSGE